MRNHDPGELSRNGSSAELSDTTHTGDSPQLSRSRRATEAAWHHLEEEFGLLEVDDVTALFPAESSTAALPPDDLITVRRGGVIRYPAFQFDREAGTVLPVIAPLLALARANDWSNEDLTLWLASPRTTFAAEDRPVDHLAEDPEAVLGAAQEGFQPEW